MSVVVEFNKSSMADYRKFLRMKRLPQYEVRADGRVITFNERPRRKVTQ